MSCGRVPSMVGGFSVGGYGSSQESPLAAFREEWKSLGNRGDIPTT